MAAIMGQPVLQAHEIKCTNCGMAIDISRAAEHVCGAATPGPMHPMDRFNQAFSSMKLKTNAPFPFDMRRNPSTNISATRASRSSPLRARSRSEASEDLLTSPDNSSHQGPLSPNMINPAEKRPFLSPPIAPPSPERAATPGPLLSPPRNGALSPFALPPRAATASPRPALRAPSPDRPLPQECAFPPFPLARSETSTDRGSPEPSRPGSPPHTLGLPPGLRPAQQDSDLRPFTPENQNRNGFAHDGGSNQSSPRSRPDTPSDSGPAPPIPPISERRKLASPGRPDTLRLPFASPLEEQEKELHPLEQSSPEPPPASPKRSLGHFRKPSMSAAMRPLHDIGCIKTHRPTLSLSGAQRRVGPEVTAPLSARLVPNERTDSRLENAPPVPAQRFLQEHAIRTDHDAHAGFSHSPTDSVSSNGSSGPTNSSRSSPPSSALSLGPNHQSFESVSVKSCDSVYSTIADSAPAAKSAGFKGRAPAPLLIRDGAKDLAPPPLSARTAPTPDLSGNPFPPTRSPALEPHEKREASNDEHPHGDKPESAFSAGAALPKGHRRPVKSFSRPNYRRPSEAEPESPMDPALNNGRLPALEVDTTRTAPPRWEGDAAPPALSAPLPPSGPEWAPSPPLPTPQTAPIPETEESAGQRTAFPPRNQSIRRQQQRFHVPQQSQPEGALRRAAEANATTPLPGTMPTPMMTRRALCRGCQQPIQGKSVSSADGQLSGRWHRTCFVCQTCASPFASSAFYVLHDHPYCARHYHQLNHTLCGGCDRGIEGPYVETDARVKFHPHCFTCQTCHLILRDVHFEDPDDGAVLCERHAMDSWLRRQQQGAAANAQAHLGGGGSNGGGGLAVPSRFPERRTTRLMMM